MKIFGSVPSACRHHNRHHNRHYHSHEVSSQRHHITTINMAITVLMMMMMMMIMMMMMMVRHICLLYPTHTVIILIVSSSIVSAQVKIITSTILLPLPHLPPLPRPSTSLCIPLLQCLSPSYLLKRLLRDRSRIILRFSLLTLLRG